MAKFLYFQDYHIKGKNSRSRLGDYFEDCLIKLDEIISIAKKNKCEALIDGGDLFETETPSYAVLDGVADRIEKGGIPLYSLFGNHAMAYGHIENSKAVGLAHLQKRSKHFKRLVELDERGFKSENPFAIVGIEYEFGIEDYLKTVKLDSYTYKNQERWTIYILHAFITPKKFPTDKPYIIAKDLKGNAPLILIAHYHQPFEVKNGDTTILDIGSCGRDNIDEANIQPSVLLIDTDEKSWKVIPLKSAKPGEEVFDLTKYAETKGKKKDIKAFLDSLKDVNFQSMDIGQQIVKIGKDQNIEQPVVDYLLKKVGENKND
jgi:DNA repair exonuclease SbcCD nuclease subunit